MPSGASRVPRSFSGRKERLWNIQAPIGHGLSRRRQIDVPALYICCNTLIFLLLELRDRINFLPTEKTDTTKRRILDVLQRCVGYICLVTVDGI